MRHGQSLNAGVLDAPDGDPGLSRDGARQAQRIARRLAAGSGLDRIHSSPARRALETAELIRHSTSVRLAQVWVDLHEQRVRPLAARAELSAAELARCFPRFEFVGGTEGAGWSMRLEHDEEVEVRASLVAAALRGRASSGERVCLVGHQRFFDRLLHLLVPEEPRQAGYMHSHGALTHLVLDPQSSRIRSLCCEEHLPLELRSR